MASSSAAAAAAAATSPTTAPAAKFKQEELEQILAPIALYPDSMLSQILMASTYPLEVVQADRWAKANKDLKDAALTAGLEKQTWDASVKSLVNFPQVLAMMSEKLDLTIKLGDAFIAQQSDVMSTIQKLRNKAQAEGNLKSNEQQKVTVEAAAAPADATGATPQEPVTQVIKIESAQPNVIYVPSYSPSYVYGAWPYPAYPPYPYYPPNYVASNMISFGAGVAVGAAWGYAWGNCNWGGNDVDIDIDRNTNINNNIDRSKYKSEFENRQTNRQSGDRSANRAQGQGRGSFQHNPQHRQGVPYRDQATSQRMGTSAQNRQTAQAREAYRGRSSGATGSLGGTGSRAGSGTAGAGSYSGNRPNSTPGRSPSNTQWNPPSRSGTGSTPRANSLDGVDRGGSAARASSQRGQASRSSSSYSRSSGAARPSGGGGGGAARGGGGGGGRGGGRR